MKSLLLLPCVLLAACAAQPSLPVVRTETVTVKVPSFVPLASALTAPVAIPEPPAVLTNANLLELAIDRGLSLQQANRQLSAIRSLQPK